MFKIYDITLPLSTGLHVSIHTPMKQLSIVGAGSGTYNTDFPFFEEEAGKSIDPSSLERLIGSCRVLDLTHLSECITREHLSPFPIQSGEFLLFKTRNSFDEAFTSQFVYLREDGAHYLVEKGVKGVGIDSMGIERNQPGTPTYRTLFDHEMMIVEGVRLRHVPEGEYFLLAAPMEEAKEKGSSAARVLLIEGLKHM